MSITLWRTGMDRPRLTLIGMLFAKRSTKELKAAIRGIVRSLQRDEKGSGSKEAKWESTGKRPMDGEGGKRQEVEFLWPRTQRQQFGKKWNGTGTVGRAPLWLWTKLWSAWRIRIKADYWLETFRGIGLQWLVAEMATVCFAHSIYSLEDPKKFDRILFLAEERAGGPQWVGQIPALRLSRNSESMCPGRSAHDGWGNCFRSDSGFSPDSGDVWRYGCPKSHMWGSDCGEWAGSEGTPSVEHCEHNVNLALEVVGQNWSSEVISIFLEDWEVGRVLGSPRSLCSECQLRNVIGEPFWVGLAGWFPSKFWSFNMVCLWNEGVPPFLLYHLIVCIVQKVGKRMRTTFVGCFPDFRCVHVGRESWALLGWSLSVVFQSQRFRHWWGVIVDTEPRQNSETSGFLGEEVVVVLCVALFTVQKAKKWKN